MSRPTGPSNKRKRPIPSDYEKTISDVTLLARKRAISLLDKCLNNHHLNAAEQRVLIIDVSRSFGLVVASDDVCIDDTSEIGDNPQLGKQRTSTRICTTSSKEIVVGKKEDDHNEVCEVCEKGGDLLCCDTCSLVFHIGCIRPKIGSIPKGKWSCAYCTSDGVGIGDGVSAKKAIIMMGRLGRGLESEDEADDSSLVAKSGRMGEVMIVRSGKRFIVRKVAHSQIIELGRYDNLDDALGSIKPVYKKILTVSSNCTFDGDTVTTPIGAVEDDDLWCTHCMDDPAVTVCAFCGCRTCFGKHNSEYLLLCDYCDQESHTYCLTPKLTEIPEDAWYCGSCINLGLVKVETEALPVTVTANMTTEEGRVEDSSIQTLPPEFPLGGIPFQKIHRVKGRPGRPKKMLSGILEDFVPVPRVAKVAGRGRGRPPGSGRIGLNEDGNIIKQTLKGPILVPVRLKCDAKLNFSADGLNAPSHYSQAAFGTSLIAGSGVKAILSIIENNGGKRCFWPSEKLVINQMKEWSPLEDLQVVHAAFIAQKDLLLQRIRDCDPTFVEQISSAKSIRNASSWISKKSSFEEKKISLQIPKISEDHKVPIVEGKSVLNHLILDDEASMDVGADFSLLSDDVINDLDLDEDMMAVDISKNIINCEDTLNIGTNAGVDATFKEGIHLGDEEIKIDEDDEESKIGEEEGEEDEENKLEEEEGEEDDDSKLEENEENDDEESKIEDEDVEDREESEEGDGENQRDREEIEDDDDESKEDRDRVCSEEEDEGVDGFDFQDAGMIKQNIDDEDAVEDEEQAGEEEDSSCDEESSDVADPDS